MKSFALVARQVLASALLLLLLPPLAGFAFETDQYNLPDAPLYDIGDKFSAYVERNVMHAVGAINAQIQIRRLCLSTIDSPATKSRECGSVAAERRRLAALQSEAAIAKAVYKLLGTGDFFETVAEVWLETNRFDKEPVRYKTSYNKSIYAISPLKYTTISSTVKIYGDEFGTDKIAHFFQQGYTYYKIYDRATTNRLNAEQAAARAVRWGKLSERTFYGTVVSGVYSNADLCANYAGMRFYQNLTRNIKLGETVKPAVLKLQDGMWTITQNTDFKASLVKPFLSPHFNEALNPSILAPGLRSFVRQTVRKQSCEQWRNRFPNRTKADFDALMQQLKLWHAEDYGFTSSPKFVTIADACFADAS